MRQTEMQFHTWGGKRAGAGRKPRVPGARPHVPHRAREAHKAAHPVHVTLRARAGLPPFRESGIFDEMRAALRDASRSPAVGEAFRVVQFSVQRDHVHLIVEAHDREMLSRGLRGLVTRLARAVNRALSIRGKVWGDRYHARELTTPRAVRNAIVYVLMNAKKHGHALRGADPCSSASWFDGFTRGSARPAMFGIDDTSPIRSPRTWLARIGWRRLGLIAPTERPRAALDH